MPREISATAVAPGIAIARVHHHRSVGEFVPTSILAAEQVEAECRRFEQACQRAGEALRLLKAKLTTGLDPRAGGIAGIYDAHIALLTDPAIHKDVAALIHNDRVNAEVAVQRVVARYEEAFRSMDSPSLRERASDIRDIGRQVLGQLLERDQVGVQGDDDLILAVDDFLPSDIGLIDTQRVRGIVMAEGGKYSHGAILAKSLGIPCLVGLESNLTKIPPAALVIVDGDRGRLIVDPDAEHLQRYQERKEQRDEAEHRIFEVRLSPSVTVDGTSVGLLANLEGPRELDAIEEGMFDGVGLFRTEFVFMERLVFPSEEDQLRLYREVVEHMRGRRVTFRTLDVGGDKPLAYLRTPAERNPVLGWRGIRLTLHWQDILYAQLRALVRASSAGPVSILLPMVTTLAEVRAGRTILDQVIADLRDVGVEVGKDLRYGVMVEVPALAQVLPRVLEEVDFISIGSNDLVQYLLAVDRDNPRVAAMYDPYHPGVLRFIASCIEHATAAAKPCSLCGEIAGEPELIPLLLGMGFRELSMAPVFLPRVKLTVRSANLVRCQELWQAVQEMATAEDVREAVRAAVR